MPSSVAVASAVPTHSSVPRIERRDAVLVSTVVLGYLALWWALAGVPFQDVPNHVSRAIVIGDLLFDGGVRFGHVYAFEWLAVPYLLGDLLLLPLVRGLPADVAMRAWVALEWASLPLATAWLLRTWRCTPAAVVGGTLLACHLATDVFFAMGFVNYRLALALALAAVAAWERLREGGLRDAGVGRWLAFAALAGAAWLMHLAGLVFLCGMLGVLVLVRAVRRERGCGTAALAAALPAALLAWHVGLREPPNPAPPIQPPPITKVLRIASPLVRYREPAEFALFGAYVLVAGVPLVLRPRPRLRERRFELLAVAAAFLALYFVLPSQRGALWAVDNRALCIAWQFLGLAAAESVAGYARRERAFVVAAAALAVANLAWLAYALAPDDARMRALRALAEEIPHAAVVLPVLTLPKHGYTNPYAHAASFATIARDAVVPYTFSADQGMPMRHFRFRDRPPAPWQFWYQEGRRTESWRGVRERYDYVYATRPVDWNAIPLPLEVVRANDAAVLARVIRSEDARAQR